MSQYELFAWPSYNFICGWPIDAVWNSLFEKYWQGNLWEFRHHVCIVGLHADTCGASEFIAIRYTNLLIRFLFPTMHEHIQTHWSFCVNKQKVTQSSPIIIHALLMLYDILSSRKVFCIRIHHLNLCHTANFLHDLRWLRSRTRCRPCGGAVTATATRVVN